MENRSLVHRAAQDEMSIDGPGPAKWLNSYGRLDYDDDNIQQKLSYICKSGSPITQYLNG